MFPEIAAIGDVDNVVINFRSTSLLKLSFTNLSKKRESKTRFPSGTLGIVNCCRYAAFGHDQRLEVFGRDGMVRFKDFGEGEKTKKTTETQVSVGNDQPTRTVLHKWDGGVSCPPLQTTPSRYPQVTNCFDLFL